MAKLLRAVGHEDQLSLVDHLDELRSRIITCLIAFFACFAICFWQNSAIIDLLTDPVKQAREESAASVGERLDDFQGAVKDFGRETGLLGQAIAADKEASPATKAAAERVNRAADVLQRAEPSLRSDKVVTFGVGEPFLVTFKFAAYAALLLCMPILLWQAYSFILPAFSPKERKAAIPLMSMVPFLFYAGVAFAYAIVLPNAVAFLQNFNEDQFDILLRADDYFRFAVMVLTVMGLLFQIPVGILLVVKMEIMSVAQLRANRRYALLIIAVMAMLLPGTDPVTMLIAMAPLLVLFEGSIVMAAWLGRRAARAEGVQEPSEPDSSD